MAVLSLVEKGWAGARWLSIHMMAQSDVSVRHLVRGTVPRVLLEALTPYARMTITGIPVRLYRLVVWVVLVYGCCTGRLAAVLVDNERAERWVARWFPWLRDHIILVHETSEGRPAIVRHGAQVQLDLHAPQLAVIP